FHERRSLERWSVMVAPPDASLFRLSEDFFEFQAGEAFDAGEKFPKSKTGDEQAWDRDHRERPRGEAAEFVVKGDGVFGRARGDDEPGEDEVQGGADQKRTREQPSAGVQQAVKAGACSAGVESVVDFFDVDQFLVVKERPDE